MFGDRIKQVRKRIGLSQADFARNLGISRAHISKLENAQAVPSRQLLTLISEIYFVRLEWLVDGVGPMEPDVNKYERDIQKIAYAAFQKNLDLFHRLYREITAYALETLGDVSKNLIPEYCPPELLERLRQILLVPHDELLVLIREILSACDSKSEVQNVNPSGR